MQHSVNTRHGIFHPPQPVQAATSVLLLAQAVHRWLILYVSNLLLQSSRTSTHSLASSAPPKSLHDCTIQLSSVARKGHVIAQNIFPGRFPPNNVQQAGFWQL